MPLTVVVIQESSWWLSSSLLYSSPVVSVRLDFLDLSQGCRYVSFDSDVVDAGSVLHKVLGV